jgi:propanol-preferring alcohol dehydrogenase
MRAWTVNEEHHRIELIRKSVPSPAASDLLVRVVTTGVCRTDLLVADDDLPMHLHGVTPGHQVVGTVEALGEGVRATAVGDLVGSAWLRHARGLCGVQERAGEPLPRGTVHGMGGARGFAEFATVSGAFSEAFA